MSPKSKCVAWATLAAVALLSTASPSQACWNCLRGRQPAAATYAPMTVGYAPTAVAPACSTCVNYAPACNPCAPTTTYMPVTSYQTVLRPVTVTTLSPVRSGCCLFGGGTTTYRPVTSIVYRPQMIPYATYQPVVYSAPVVATSAMPCNACTAATTTYRIGSAYTTLSSAVSSCPTSDYGAPVVTQMPAATLAPALAPTPAPMPAPTLPATSAPAPAPAQAMPPSTYERSAPAGSQQQQQQPQQQQSQPPGTGTNTGANPMRVPQMTQPSVQPASQPLVRQAVYYRPMPQKPASQVVDSPALDVGGWHAASN